MEEIAPIHAKLAVHAEDGSFTGLKTLLEEHHENFPPAFVWAKNLLLVIENLEKRINELESK